MRELFQGVKVIDLTGGSSSLADRLRLSSGVENGENLPGELRYCPYAMVPGKPWRKPTKSETDILSSKNIPEEIGLWVGLIRLPRLLLARFSLLKGCNTSNEVDSWLETETAKHAIHQLQLFSSELDTSTLKSDRYGIGWNAPNQITVTITGNCCEGLHVDNGEGVPLSARNTANNRLMVNLGKESRYFLFINLPMQVIYEFVFGSEDSNPESNPGMSRVGLLFMEKYRSYPVLRLKVQPGEAYIAPTANIIHDGSTEGMKSLDKIFTCLGSFSLLRYATKY